MIGNVDRPGPGAVRGTRPITTFKLTCSLSLSLSVSFSVSLARSLALALPARRVPVPDERFDFLVDFHKPAR